MCCAALEPRGQDAATRGQIQRPSSPVCHHPTGLLDDHGNRQIIIGLQIVIDDHVDITSNDQRVGITIISETPRAPGRTQFFVNDTWSGNAASNISRASASIVRSATVTRLSSALNSTVRGLRKNLEPDARRDLRRQERYLAQKSLAERLRIV